MNAINVGYSIKANREIIQHKKRPINFLDYNAAKLEYSNKMKRAFIRTFIYTSYDALCKLNLPIKSLDCLAKIHSALKS